MSVLLLLCRRPYLDDLRAGKVTEWVTGIFWKSVNEENMIRYAERKTLPIVVVHTHRNMCDHVQKGNNETNCSATS